MSEVADIAGEKPVMLAMSKMVMRVRRMFKLSLRRVLSSWTVIQQGLTLVQLRHNSVDTKVERSRMVVEGRTKLDEGEDYEDFGKT